MILSSPAPDYRLLSEFEGLFKCKVYRHRDSTQGDFVATHLYEDLLSIDRSPKYVRTVVERQDRVLNTQNLRRGVKARRGDGTLGQIIPGEAPIFEAGYAVGRGTIATVEIGIEVKILFKAMIKQIDRVMNDLRNQAQQFRRGGGDPIRIGIVGINRADYCIGYEKDRQYPTTGRGGFPHPMQESEEAEKRLEQHVRGYFDEFLVLRFKATNEPPFPFEWVDLKSLRLDYGAALTRVSSEFEKRF